VYLINKIELSVASSEFFLLCGGIKAVVENKLLKEWKKSNLNENLLA